MLKCTMVLQKNVLILGNICLGLKAHYAFKWKWKSLSRVRLFATPQTIQSMEFSRPEYWRGYYAFNLFTSSSPQSMHMYVLGWAKKFSLVSCKMLPVYIYIYIYIHLNGEGNGTPLQYSCLENPMDGGAWWAAIHGVAESQTWLSDFIFTFHFPALEKEMATHSSVLAWRIPGTGEPGGLPSMGSHRVRHDWSNLAAHT